jgi:hypothetical protein
MLDLKAKLAAAGLVTPADIAAAEKPARPAPRPPARPRTGLDLPALRKAGKGEVYEAVRRAVDRQRLDAGVPGEAAEPFHFTTAHGQLSRLILEPPAHAAMQAGEAGIVAFMSHHGLAHAVVPRPLAEAVAELMPLWLRVLKDHPAAGQLEKKPAPPAAP